MTTRLFGLFFVGVLCLGAAQPVIDPKSEPTPFWQKPKIYRQIKDQRAIIVSARHEEAGGKKLLNVVTAGHIHAPLKFTWDHVTDFEKYPKWTDHFQEVIYDKAKKQVFVHGVALGYHAKMWVQMTFFETDDDKEIRWRVFKGSFEGMEGNIRVKAFNMRHTEISLNARLEAETIPLPTILMGVGLEAIAQRVSGLIRQQVETAWKQK